MDQEEDEISGMFMISELLFYLIIVILILLIGPTFVLYPGLYYGRWKTRGPVFDLTTKDGTQIEGLIMDPPEPDTCDTTILFFHGNSSNMGNRSPFLQQLNKEFNAHVLSIDYRGFGNSYGFPSESGLINDAESIFERIINDPKFENTKKVVYGRSLGGAVAIALAENVKGVDYLVLENTFGCTRNAASRFPLFNKVPGFILDFALYPNSWDSETRIKTLDPNINMLFLSGLKDRVVNPKDMEKLHTLCKSKNKKLVTVEEGTHNDTYLKCDLKTIISDFLKNQ